MYDAIIIGAGPAGLMAGIEASKNKNILLIEKNNTPGKKLLITGGGRCNLTNLKTNNDFLNNVDYNKKYLFSTINNFGPKDIYDFFVKNGVVLKEEKENQIFPFSNKASEILEILIKNTSKMKINYNEKVINIFLHQDYKEVITNKNSYKTKNIVIATGGSSFKQTGSDGDNIKFASSIKQPIVPIFPAETSIELEEKLDLAGVSFDSVQVIYQKQNSFGNLIFTHKGLSGTSIMKMSEHIYKSEKKIINIDLIPDINKEDLIEKLNKFDRDKELGTFFSMFFSKRFSSYLVNRLNKKSDIKIKQLNSKDIVEISSLLKYMNFNVKKVNDLETAYVTGGGIDLKYLDSKTFESKINEGIYFAGEALDIHGPIGGYNITLALSTGYTVGNSLRKK